MSANRGKDFEALIRKGAEEQRNVSIDRFPDPTAGFLGVRNICDFVVYKYPFQYYLECKTIKGNTLNFKSGITQNQWQGLEEKSKLKGVTAGILVWFIEHDITVFVDITELGISRMKGAKSLNVKDVIENKIPHIKMKGPKKRVFFDYEMDTFFRQLYAYTSKKLEGK